MNLLLAACLPRDGVPVDAAHLATVVPRRLPSVDGAMPRASVVERLAARERAEHVHVANPDAL